MILKKELNKKAIFLRKRGLTYSQILKEVGVAKSTLSLWLRQVSLSKKQNQKITENRLNASKKGGLAKKNQRILKTQKIISTAISDVDKISKRELWLIGITLYWAEGSKEKEYHPGSGVKFINMDENMIVVFLKWLDFCKVEKDRISFDIYIHENHKYRISNIKKYWSKVTNFPITKFKKVYFKRNIIKTKRRKVTNDHYFGIVKVAVKESSSFLRQINGWTKGIFSGIMGM